MRLQLLMQTTIAVQQLQLQQYISDIRDITIHQHAIVKKSAETENDSLKSKEFTVVQFKKSQHAIVNI